LAALKYCGKEPSTIIELVKLLCPDCLVQLNEYPWHKDAVNREIFVDDAEITIASAVLGDDLASNGIELLELKSCCLDVAFYNKMINCMRNKANVLFSATSQLIKNAFDSYPGEDIHIIVDRQGGRVHYREHLQRMFSDMELSIMRETPQESIYRLQTDSRVVSIKFVVNADENFLPVSLASMVSKYLRELLVNNINRYFLAFCPDIKPTAGYWKDGLRFIEDLHKKAPHVKFNREQLIRSR
jgi:ribonuclease HII